MKNKTDLSLKPISLPLSVILFLIPALYFILITRVVIPILKSDFLIHPALSWFIGGLLIFPLLLFAALFLLGNDGYRGRSEIFQRLRLTSMSARDWKHAFISLLAIFILMGFIMLVSKRLSVRFGIPVIQTTPSFLAFDPLTGNQRWLLLIWLVMFFFNMVGEELLWRGYILPRQEISFGRYAWILNAFLWTLFHICFGLDLMILLTPILFILPYAVYKTGNTVVGLIIHAVLNGPMFILVSLGIIH